MKTALQTAAAIAAGETSARAETEAAIARIESLDGPINAVVVRDFDRALSAADRADTAIARGERKPFLGVPMTVKEAFDVAGLPTSWGLPHAAANTAETDAVVVQRMKAAGAIILGKTNIAPALADWQSDNPVYGRTSHPADSSRTAGGSSGGSGAALACGMVPMEIGSDIGGSIRIPASFCGVWGHKPSYGVIDAHGHRDPGTDGAEQPLTVVGPMARDPDDLAAMLDVLADAPLPRFAIVPDQLRLLILDAHPAAPLAPSIHSAIDRLAHAAAAIGITIARESDLLPNLAVQHRAYGAMLALVFARGAIEPGGQSASLTDWFDLLDEQARNRRAWGRLFDDFDAVLSPANIVTAFPHRTDPFHERRMTVDGQDVSYDAQLVWPGLATFPGLPVTAFPAGVDPDGLPIGLQVMTGYRADTQAIAIAKLLHGALP